MRKWLIPLAVLFAVYVLHGRYVFSKAALQPWLTGLSELTWRNAERACTFYDADVVVNISPEVGQGSRQPIGGGHNEICDYLKNTAQDIKVIDAVAFIEITDLVVIQRGFPWTEATVSYTRHMRLLPPKREPINLRQADTLLLHRGLTGVKITRVHSVIYRGAEQGHSPISTTPRARSQRNPPV